MNAISARISFTDNLIDSTALQGSDPILSGATGRLWLSTTTHQLRLELQGANGDAQILVKNGAFSIYDPMSNTVYKGTLPTGGSQTGKTATDTLPSVAQIQSELKQLAQHIDIAGPYPRNVAGQPAYKVVLTPKHSGGLLGSVQLAWDATHGVPLGIAIYSVNSSSPVLELKATHISYGAVSARVFKVSPPAGAKVVRISTPAGHAAAHAKVAKAAGKSKHRKHAAKPNTEITGARAVQAHLPFTLAARKSLDGLPRQSVQLLDWGGSPAALVTYGQGLGGIAVIEQTAAGQSSSGPGATPRVASTCRPCRSTGIARRSCRPRSERSCGSQAVASNTPCSVRCRRRRPRWRRGSWCPERRDGHRPRYLARGGAPGPRRSSAR